MNLEITCDKLLQEIPVLLSKNNPELALLYFHAVLHMAERDKLPVTWIDELIIVLPQIINLLAMDKQIAAYERLLKLAEKNQLVIVIANLHQVLGELHTKRTTQMVKPIELKQVLPKPERYPNHLTALANFVKARTTFMQSALENANPAVVNNQLSINRLEVNCHFDLLLGLYKSQFVESKNKTKADVVSVLECYIVLATRLQGVSLLTEAISVYQQVFEVLSIQQSFYEKTCLKDVDETFLLDSLLQLSEPNLHLTIQTPFWQLNLDKLRELRGTFKKRVSELYKNIDLIRYDINQMQQLEQLQVDLTIAMKEFTANLFKQAEALLGPAPCAYSVLGMGSIARGDMTPFSDLESVLLVEQDISKNSAAKNYFETLLRLVEFQVHSLGESFDDNPGFHLDKECHPLIMPELIGIPEQLLQRFKLTDLSGVSTEQEGNGLLAYTLLRPTLVHGSASLFDKYQALVTQALNHHTETRQAKAKEFLKAHVKTFQEETRKSFEESNQFKKGCQIKKSLLGPLTHLLVDLAFHHHLAGVNLVDILSELSEQRILNAEFAQVCRGALAELNLLRLRMHLERNQQNDTLIETSAIQIVRLQTIFNGIYVALYCQPERLFVNVNKPYHPVIDPLSEINAGDTAKIAAPIVKNSNPTLTTNKVVIEITRSATSRSGYESIFLTAVNYLVFSQQPTDVDSVSMCEVYQALPISLRPELLKKFAVFEPWLLGDQFKLRALKQLTYQPNPDGWYPAMEEESNAWLKVFSTLFQTNATAEMIQAAKQRNAVVVHCGNLRGGMGVSEYLLHDAVRAQLFEPNGKPKAKPEHQRGRHTVLQITHLDQIFWFKFTPEQAGTEYAVNRLARYIGDQGTPMTQVIKLCYGNQTECIAVQVTPHIEGLTLEETLQKYPERLQQLSLNSFTETLLRVLLTNPEDDKGDDYFLILDENNIEETKLSFRLVRIDNERVFYDPLEMKGLFKTNEALQVKSMLYCLQQMQQPLSQAVLNKFLELDPLLVLQRWLNELQVEHQRYQGLFTDKDIEMHFSIKEPGSCLLGIPIAEGLIEELLTRLDSMQQVIRLARELGGKVIGMDLLKVVQPTLADYYADTFKALPNLTSQTVLQRFDNITKNLYQRSKLGIRESRIQSAKAITQSLRLKTKLTKEVVLQMAHAKQNSPAQGLEALQNLQSKILEDIKKGLLSDNPKDTKAAITHFQNLVVRQRLQLFKELVIQHGRQALSANQQITLLQAIAGIPFHELSLQAFNEVLSDKLLQPILGGAGVHLIKLDLQDCMLLTDKSMEQLTQLSPNLVYLHLKSSAVNAQTNPKEKLQTLKGSFPKLTVLDVNDCLDLVVIDINAPQLAQLKARKCRQLREVKTRSLLLKVVNMMGCQALEEKGILEVSKFAGRMQEVKLEQSGVTQQEFRELYPYLVMLPLDDYSEQFIKNLTEWLQAEITTCFPSAGSKEVLLDSHSANQLYEKITQRFQLIETLLKSANNFMTGIFVNNGNKRNGLRLLGCIAGVGYKSEIILSMLIAPLKDTTEDVRTAATKAVGQATMQIKLPSEILMALLPLLKDSSWDVRAAAAGVVGQASKYNSAEVLSVLLPLLKDSEWRGRAAAARAVDEMSKKIKLPPEVLMALLPLLKDSRLDVRAAAAEAVGGAAMKIKLPTEVLSALLPLLNDSDKDVRDAAVIAVGMAGMHNPTLMKDIELLMEGATAQAVGQAAIHNPTEISAVLLLLKDSQPDVRVAAVQTIGQAANQIKLPTEVLMALLPVLKDFDSNVKRAAAEAVGQAAMQIKLSNEVLMELLPLLKDSDLDVRRTAAMVVGQAAKQIKLPTEVLMVLLSLLKDWDEDVRAVAAQVVGQAAKYNPGEVLSTVLTLLKDFEREVRKAAAHALGEAATQNPIEVLTAILPLLKDVSWDTRAAAAKAVGQAAMQIKLSNEVLMELLPLLKDSDLDVRRTAAVAVGQATMQIKLPTEVLMALLPLLKDSDSDVRKTAAMVVGQAAKQIKLPTEALIALLPLLKDSDKDVRVAAAEAMEQTTRHNSTEVPIALLPLLKDSDSYVIRAAAKVIGQAANQIKLPTEVLMALLPVLKDFDSNVKRAAAEALGQAAKQIKLSNEVLMELLPLLKDSDSDESVRRAAVEAMGQAARHNSTEILMVLLPLLKDPNPNVKRAAAEVVDQAARHYSTEILMALLPLLKDSDSDVKRIAAEAVGQAAKQIKLPPEILMALLPLLKNTDKDVRRAAVEAMGQAARHNSFEVLPVLLPLLRDSDENVRRATTKALGNYISNDAFRDAFKNDIKAALQDAKNIAINDLSLRTNMNSKSSNHQSNASLTTTSTSTNASNFWNENSDDSVVSVSSSASASATATAITGLSTNIGAKR
jgi:HEAT repeat protein